MKRKTVQMIMALGSICLFLSCQQPSSEGVPNDLDGLRKLQKEKRTAIKELEKELTMVQARIDSLDPNNARKASMVTVDTLIRTSFDEFIEVQGVVTSQENVNATSELGGRIVQLMVEEGQKVRAGQLVASVDAEVLLSQKKELETQLQFAQTVYERQKKLWDQNLGSEVSYLDAKTRKESLEQSMKTIEANLQKTNVYAPKSGIVDRINLKAGEFAAPGAPVVSIIDHRRLKVELEIPETYLGRVRKGDVIELKFPSIGLSQYAKIHLLGSTINPNNRTVKAEARIALDENRLIRPNMLAIGMINDLHLEDVIQVPINIVQQEVSGKDYVLIVGTAGEETIALKQYVKVGPVYGGMAVIEEGLKEGMMILKEGARGLSAQEPIQIATVQ